MLDTLLKIGKWQSQGKTEWDRFLAAPKISTEDKKGNKITNYVLPILFDLDEKQVVVDKGQLCEFREEHLVNLKALKIQGGNNKAIYSTVPADKLIQLIKTFFGKVEDANPEIELLEAIKKIDDELLTDPFKDLLLEIFSLREQALEKVQVWNKNKEKLEINKKRLEEELEVQANENLALIFIAIKSTKHQILKPTPFAELKDYRSFLRLKFGLNKSDDGELSMQNIGKKLCYASGKQTTKVDKLGLTTRYSINKMFVTETKNYATLFTGKKFMWNYQVSKPNQEKLDYASSYLLNNLKTKIANIDHVIIPQFQESDNFDLELALSVIKKKSDILFNFDSLDHLTENIEDETKNVFWLSFLAFESDGNFFKSTEIIKDVSKFHFQKVLSAFTDVHWDFKEVNFVDWNSVMTEYGKPGRLFNFNSVYGLIPIRKDKEKKNKSLDLFKAVLENRKVRKAQLFTYFSELMLCHFYERYNSYTNVHDYSQKGNRNRHDYFSWAVRDSVFKYLGFFQVLKKLNLIDMEDSATNHNETVNKYDIAIQDFFTKMDLNQDQQAMFYLGRMLNAVEYIQIKKKIKKTVINLVNFNGLDRDDIERLRNDLINKARQHSQMGKVVFTNGKFSEEFDYNNWKMEQTEALFFLLSGYSFGTNKKEEEEREIIESEIEDSI